MFTCISCRVAFEAAAEQRQHFATDWHRYNMKRRVADLPPLPAAAFNEKVLERREQNAVRTDPRGLHCSSCSKSFSSENAFRSHVQSKKHREREAVQAVNHPIDHSGASTSSQRPLRVADNTSSGGEDEDEDEDEVEDEDEDGMSDGDIDERLAASRRRRRPTDCLFCTSKAASISDILSHMSRQHSFFIPDQDRLVDIGGLLSYLGEKVSIGNLCLYCPNGGKEFASLEAVRQHMVDKAHCKIAYDDDEDQAELADFYDYGQGDAQGSDWEDVDMDFGEDDEGAPALASLAADGLSLVLPSGRTVGHRSLKVYYSQRLRASGLSSHNDVVSSKVALVRERLADPAQALVPVAGGHGAFGKGQQLIKARNAGEANWAKKAGRSYQDQKRRDDFRTKIGFKHNNQKLQ
ncbi:hypothetical protein JCM24511_06864 [Saitozyma sp. JCM 24511]|nr:hypothetical protein JCM24511_06864 [Saitozyma sp. JCM 24511]